MREVARRSFKKMKNSQNVAIQHSYYSHNKLELMSRKQWKTSTQD